VQPHDEQVVEPDGAQLPAAHAVHAPFFCVPSALNVPAAHGTPAPAHTPPVQTSGEVPALPSSQVEPLALAGLAHAPFVALHVPTSWH
jgi:hypothetical protein